jgi:hypothetical protein
MLLLAKICMKIDENLVNRAKMRVYEGSYRHTLYPNGIPDDDYFSYQFLRQGRAGGLHALRAAACSAYVINC